MTAAFPADSSGMARFWFWGVRNPCVVLAAAILAAAYEGIADDAIIYSLLLVVGLVAAVAMHRGRRARSTERRRKAAELAIREATTVRERLQQRKAA